MKAEICNLDSEFNPEVHITHEEEKLIFNAANFGRENFRKFDVFKQLNDYWKSLTEPQQLHIFLTYKEIRHTFDTVWDQDSLTIELNKKVIKLLDLYDFDELLIWVSYKSDIIIPPDFEHEYIHSVDNHKTRDQTYIRTDYVQLVTLSLLMRVMIPVWGEFIHRTRQDYGTDFKEHYAFKLLNNSSILHKQVFDKLRLYIELTVGKEKDNPNTIIKGIDSETFPVWMLGLAIIRRLAIGDIRGVEPKVNLITFMHKFITQRANNNENNGANTIKPKLFEDSNSPDTEAKLSALERYKIKMPISTGEVTELEFSISNLYHVIMKLCPGIEPELLNKCMASSQRLMEYDLLEPQITLLRWVFKPVISPIGIKHILKQDIIISLGICQAVLWTRGHKYLALMSTSYAEVNNLNTFNSGIDTRGRISKELIDEISLIYPYDRRIGNKKSQQKPVNVTLNAIDRLVSDLSSFVWNMTADMEYISETFNASHNRRIPITHNIKTELAHLVIQIGKRNW